MTFCFTLFLKRSYVVFDIKFSFTKKKNFIRKSNHQYITMFLNGLYNLRAILLDRHQPLNILSWTKDME